MAKSKRVWAFIDGDPFSAIARAGQAPHAAVAHSLKRKLGADVVLSFQESIPQGSAYRAQWFDSKSGQAREARVDIWRP